MTAATTSDTELLTEHFGYPPVSLLDDIINSVNILAERALNSVEQGLLNAPPATLGFKQPIAQSQSQSQQEDPAERAKTEIESGTHQLETLLCAAIDKNFDIFEIFALRNFLCVRPPDLRSYIRLSHYEGLDFSSTSVDAAAAERLDGNGDGDKATLESINMFRVRLRESMRLNALLHAEQQRNARLLSGLRTLVGANADEGVKAEESSNPGTTKTTADDPSPLAFLHRDVGPLTDAGSEPLSTTTAFTLSQLQALRALSQSLRTMAPDLTSPSASADGANDDMDGGNKSWRRQRLEYVEGATRRHLEAVQGLELGKYGEVVDGEWQGEGGRLGSGEVEGLERVVAIIESQGKDDGERMNES